MNPDSLLNSVTSSKWKRIGINKRSGVALPLFSVYSADSIGSGEIPDLKLVIDWCCRTGMSIVQLLPLNELGSDFAPYNSISTFAIEPMYLSIKKLKKADLKPFRSEIRKLKKIFPAGGTKVNYNIKNAKLELLRKIFSETDTGSIPKFKKYTENNFHWLKYYCLFKILTKINNDTSWQDWDLKYKYIAPLTAERLLENYENDVKFFCWIQWQLFEQLVAVKKYAMKKNVFLMGDIPFLAARNSADVWAYKNYFKLQLSSGAPPDMYFSKGQRWGMPPYNWDNITADNFSYIRQKLNYAENFYDMYRIDHFVGLFRIWTVDLKAAPEFGGMDGKFDPEDEIYWEKQGRNILQIMTESTSMLPCAEDLGTVPACSDKVLKEFGVTGIEVQRWKKSREKNYNFCDPGEYRINSVATLSTHDSSSLPSWYENEAGTVDEVSFSQICERLNLQSEKYFYLKEILFDKIHSVNGRLSWDPDISNVWKLLDILGLNYESAAELTELYRSTFNEKKKFRQFTGVREEFSNKASAELIKSSLMKISESDSVFSIQLLMEYLYLNENILNDYKGHNVRINFPGTVSDDNWTMIIPVSLEELINMDINESIREINLNSGRI